jgi:hypothetical protein
MIALSSSPAGPQLRSPAEAAKRAFALPDRIKGAQRARLEEVVGNAAVSTRMEGEPYVTRWNVFEYLLDHPAFATEVTRALKVARFRIWQTKDGYSLDDGWGVKGDFFVVHAEPGRRIFYARGTYKQTVLPDIHGEAVLAIEYSFRPDGGGGSLVATAITGHVALESRLLGLVARLLGPVAQRKADREARSLLKVFAKVSRAIEERPDWVYEQLGQRPDVPRRELEEFGRLLHR